MPAVEFTEKVLPFMSLPESLVALLRFRVPPDHSAPVAHLIGINGSGMKALAEFLLDLGWDVHGSDTHPLPRHLPAGSVWHRVRFTGHHDARNLSDAAAVVVHSPAIPADSPERMAAEQRGIPVLSYVDMLAGILSSRKAVCIAGTHGKTTTTAMVATILRESRLSPSAIIGGETIGYQRSGWAGDSELIVVEACEYRSHFLQFRPNIAAILNVEADHFDCFATLAAAQTAFVQFSRQTAPGGYLLLPAAECAWPVHQISCRVARFSVAGSPCPTTPGETAQADGDLRQLWHASAVMTRREGTRFRLTEPAGHTHDVTLPLFGVHNVHNAVAAIAVAHAAGVPPKDAIGALSRFRGVRRRFEIRGEYRGATIIDDYAHHSTAVRLTLETARRAFPDRRIVAAFQPHQVSRTRRLMTDFADALSLADEVILVPIFAAREDSQIAEQTLTELVQHISESSTLVRALASLDHLSATLDDSVQPGDVWLFLGAGTINQVSNEFARTIQRNHSG